MYTTPIAFLLLFIVGTQCTHYRGGAITWSTPKDSNVVNFQVTTYWNASFIPESLDLDFGDGSAHTAKSFSKTLVKGFATLTFTISHDYQYPGTYVASFEECCRISQLRGGAGDQPDRLVATVLVDETYRQSPNVRVPPVVTFKIGFNSFPLTASLPVGTWDFSDSSLSGLPYDYVFSPYSAGVNPAIKPVSSTAASFNWQTTSDDVGLWAVSIHVSTTSGSYTVDFLVNVLYEYTVPNPPYIQISPPLKYGLTDGQTASFTITCPHSDSSTAYQIISYGGYEGLTFNGQASAVYDTTANTAVTVSFAPTPDYSYADNIPYNLDFACYEVENHYATYGTVIVTVGKPLTLTPPPSTTVDCVSPCKCLNVSGYATYSDGCCGIAKVWYEDSLPASSCNTQVTRTWYAENDCGQKATAKQIIYVNDQTPPTITADGFGPLNLQCPNIPIGTPAAKDTCSAVTISTAISPPLSTACVQNVVRTFTATDRCGNNATLRQNIKIQDTTRPTLFRTVESTFSYKRECPFQSTAFDGIVRANDNCSPNLNVSFVDVNRPVCGKWTRQYSATDRCTNTATLSIELEVSHTNPPKITLNRTYVRTACPTDTSYVPRPTAVSHCGDSLPVKLVSEEIIRDSRTCPIKAVRTWSATDACGNVGTAVENITLNDDVPPTICVPADIVVECVYGSKCYTPCSDYYHPSKTGGFAHGSDLCGQKVTISHSDAFIPGDCRYTTTSDKINRTWTATDVCGNSVSKSQIIIIADRTAPEFVAPPDFTGQCVADIASAASPKNFSDCKTVISYKNDTVLNKGAGTCQDITISRRWTVIDECGNSNYSTQLITIKDTIKPKITVPCNTTVECAPKANTSYTGVAHGSDNCLMGKDASHRDVVVTDTYLIRTWTVYDACGNEQSGNQTIYFNNSVPDITCPPDVTVSCFDSSSPNVTGSASAKDLCTGNITPSYSDSENATTCPRVITRTWYAYNPTTKQSSSCVQRITVWHNEGPHLKVPSDQTVQCPFHATVGNTGSACSARVCIDENVTVPTYTDAFVGTRCESDYAIKRTWTTHDDCNRETSRVQTVYIYDTTPPVITVPADCTVTCRLNITTCGTAYVSDNCDQYGSVPPVLTSSDNLVASRYSCPSSILRLWTATDCSKNVAKAEQSIFIEEPAPVFDPYTPTTLPPVQCVECLTFSDIYATGSCGERIKAVPTVTKSGVCPTTVTITWVARDDCGRESIFVQTVLVEDTTPPELDVSGLKDIVVECDADIPTTGVVQASDNCALVGVPTFTDKFVPGNCTCDSCTKTLERTWVVRDRCGLESKTYVQRIISVKTKNPIITVPDIPEIPCGSAYTADDDGTGYATAVDSCGSPLFVTYVDERDILADGTIQITRHWSTSDNCNHVATEDQIIKIKASTTDSGYTFRIPPARHLPCNGNIHSDESLFPSYSDYSSDYTSDLYVYSPCGNVSVTNHLDASCSLTNPGHYQRTWNALLNGKVFESKVQDIYVADCPSYGKGIAGLPTAPVAVSRGFPASVAPSFTVYDLDIPCDTFTVTWTWGDYSPSTTYTCAPSGTNSRCSFDEHKSSLTVSASHNYTSAGVWNITVTVSGQRSNGYNDARATSTVVTADRYSGTVSGCVTLDYTDDDIVVTPPLHGGYAPSYSCVKPWIIKTLDGYTSSYISLHCAGKPRIDFSASFIPSDSGLVQVKGSVTFSWDTCAGGLTFNSSNTEHLSVWPDGSALWTGKISYSKIPGTLFSFSLYVIDNGKYGDNLHFRVTDSAGTVIFDTDPCMPPVDDYKVQPTTDPVNYQIPSGSNTAVYTPTDEQVAAITNEAPDPDGTPVAPQPKPPASVINSAPMIIGIVTGVMVFVVIVAIIVFFLLKQQQGKTYAANTQTYM